MSEAGSDETAELSETGPTVVDGPKPKPKVPEQLAPGSMLGRYIVLDTLGHGGMGMVYKAHDPELDRQIAVKLVKGRRKRSAQERLLREAQALGQLSHPNVISVYDVGTLGTDVFIAMELVDGVDAREWLRSESPSRAEILKLFLAAGRGLDAAHEAGLVHRDFKPDNLVIGADGRPRVIDFGLARVAGVQDLDGDLETGGPESGSQTASSSGSSTGKNRLSEPLTQAGSVLGTPAYMAPEQHLGQEVDARSDQFSFCVSLYRALYGARPFSGDSPKDLRERVTEGQMDPLPSGAKVPRWIRKILLRGLSVDPEERYPKMAALLADLERDPAIQRNRFLRAGGFAAIVASAVFLLSNESSEKPLCQEGASKLEGVWDGKLKAATKSAFLATGRGHAGKTFELVDQRLDQYGNDWVEMYTESCKATHLRGEQSETLLDLRTECLERRLGKMAAITSLLSEVSDPAVVDRAVVAASLPELSACADVDALRAAVPRPDSAETWAAAQEARKSIDRAEAMTKSGDYQAALELATQIVDSVEELDYAPVRAEALYLLGGNQRRRRKAAEAEETLYAALLAAAEARNDDLAAKAWLELLWVLGYSKGDAEAAMRLKHVVEPAVLRAGSPQRRGDFLNNFGAVLRRKGKYPEAREHVQEAVRIWSEVYGEDSLQVAKAHNNLGNVLNDMGEFLKAREHHQRVVEIRRKALGPHHPYVASALNNLGISFMEQGDFAQALDYYQQSFAIADKLDPTSDDSVMALNNMGNANAELGRFEISREQQEGALAIQEGREERDESGIGITINNLGDLALLEKSYELAQGHYIQSRDLFAGSLGAEHSYVAHATVGLGNALIGQEKFEEARAHFEQALKIWRQVHGDKHVTIAVALSGLGRCDLGLGRAPAAIAELTESLSIRQASGADLLQVEATRFELARAYLATGDKKRALELADEALAGMGKQPELAKESIEEVRAWIDSTKK